MYNDNGSNHTEANPPTSTTTTSSTTTTITTAAEATATGDININNGGAADSSDSSGVAGVDEMIVVPIDASCSSYQSPSYWEGSHSMLVDNTGIEDNIVTDVSTDNIDASTAVNDHDGDLPHLTDTKNAFPLPPDNSSSPVVASMMSPDEDVNTTNSSPDSATARPTYSPLADCLALAPTVSYWTNPQSDAW